MDITGFAAVTGAASGIGRACARAFARDGAAGVALLDLNASALDDAKKEVQALSQSPKFHVTTYVLDVTDEEAVNKTIAAIAADFGRLDYVVNAAGISIKHEGGAAFAQTKDWSLVLNVNLNGTFFVLRAAARIMLEQEPIRSSIDGRALQRGSIVNFGSILGVTGVAMSTAYTASKHAVHGLTRTASEDYAPKGLRINAVCPGYTDTPMLQTTATMRAVVAERAVATTPIGRLGRPEEIADAVMFLSGGRSSYVTGSTLMVDGGYTQR